MSITEKRLQLRVMHFQYGTEIFTNPVVHYVNINYLPKYNDFGFDTDKWGVAR